MARLKKLAECWTERTRTAGVIGAWVKGWMASALLATEKNFRKIMGYRDLWTLDAILNGSKSVTRREVA